MISDRVICYTDGSCFPNPGPAGWGAVMVCPGKEPDRPVLGLSGALRGATNNVAELLAPTIALESLKGRYRVLVVTDSLYVAGPYLDGRIKERRASYWMDSRGADIPNADLFRELDIQVKRHDTQFMWVKGHKGDPGNEYADFLAGEARKLQAGRRETTTWQDVEERFRLKPARSKK